jgi:hypothetical protein
MRKLLYITLLVLPVFVFGEVDTDGDASEAAEFHFVIPEIVGIEISTAPVEWDFSAMAGFPPDPFSLPEYYEPTTPAARPHQTIDYLVWGFGNSSSWQVTVAGDADPAPACGILLGDIEYAEDDGAGNLTSGWTAFTTTDAAIQTGSANTGGWATMYQDYQVNITGDETYTTDSYCTITYTIQTL